MPKDGDMRTTNFIVKTELWIRFRMLCLRLGQSAKQRLALLIERDVREHDNE